MHDRVTLDASVVVSAFSPAEASSKDSRRLLDALRRNQTVIVVPTLVRPEIVAAVRRSTGDQDKAKALEESFAGLPGIIFQDLDDRMGDAAVEIAAATGLRGADSVYAATARHFDAILITLDSEQRTRLPADIIALYPSEALETM
ncbi:MAG: type II toxin-antitoxin system VapC family toxin [Thermoleophilia bacterium]|nr:type II toxin-antitoxin system VapC family toxin [Thermoleophilia bacterium]